jgi:hypothetical protein
LFMRLCMHVSRFHPVFSGFADGKSTLSPLALYVSVHVCMYVCMYV